MPDGPELVDTATRLNSSLAQLSPLLTSLGGQVAAFQPTLTDLVGVQLPRYQQGVNTYLSLVQAVGRGEGTRGALRREGPCEGGYWCFSSQERPSYEWGDGGRVAGGGCSADRGLGMGRWRAAWQAFTRGEETQEVRGGGQCMIGHK